ncbi:Major centromere autoantigen B [Pleurostoma richardsiae]|uniref:Major centromere autoantigen B n=1 Tax=Pleurostoma richardsiae TaxID=41990 RepID=A0AA38VWQ7_9PEZI|nr:Major centromere autoantigen B [Pleurostoma richardsiae]
MPDYGGHFGFMPPITHGLPSESIPRMPPPPPPQPMHPSQQGHPPLSMLVVPSNPTWPSMYTNPSPSSYSSPPVPLPQAPAPLPVPLKTTKLPPLHTSSTPRKTLTDDDRRRMCQFAEDNPGMKQTEIGSHFGVERSTVSKVLRQKEKYLFPEDRSSSPVRRAKGKLPDIEKALASWARNAQKSGHPITDAEIKERAQYFAAHFTAGESPVRTSSHSWLEKFKQKNGIGPGRLMRRASETNIPDSAHMSRASPSLTPSQPSSAISPSSPSLHPSPSPLSANRSDEEKDAGQGMMDFTPETGSYKHAGSQSATSLSSAFTDTAVSSFSGSALSPTAQFTFSPDPSVGGFLQDQSRQLPPGGASSNFQRPRSQTFPTLDLEYMNQQQGTEPLTPKYHISTTAPSSALDSPENEITSAPFGIDNTITSPQHQLHHSNSNSSISGRQTGTPVTSSAVLSTPGGSSPTSPTQEDARRAADTLLSFITNVVPKGFVDQNEFAAIVRLTERLRLHQHQTAKTVHGLGGLSRIPEGDSEMTNAPPPVPMSIVKAETTLSN